MSSRLNLNLTAALLMLLPLVTAATTQPAARFSIPPQRVAEALTSAGVPATAAQVRFLSQVSATVENSDLQVMNVTKWTGNTVKVELRCHDHRACLPFYVLLSSGTADTRGRVVASGAGTSQKPGAVVPIPATQVLMRDGDPATLVFEDKALRITMPVICLQSGNRGEKIRVVSTDHKRFFKAEIVQAGLLKATL
jgi:hypothetical protein